LPKLLRVTSGLKTEERITKNEKSDH
jgi:hypothetical protein